MSGSPPLRFLIMLLAGWTGLRAAWLAPSWWTAPAGDGPRERAAAPGRTPVAAATHPRLGPPASPAPPARFDAAPIVSSRRASRAQSDPPGRAPVARLAWTLAPGPADGRQEVVPPVPSEAGRAAAAAGSRWSFATWSFLRAGDATPLAAAGRLGGSQAGARIAYRLNEDRARPLAATARLNSPLRRPAAAEAALGVDWKPWSRAPIHLLGERRQRLGREGRSAFGLTVYGGVDDAALGAVRVEAYAQAGMVGLRSRDLFGDGALRLSMPLSRLRAGAGAWAAAQPGLARLDLGPQLSLRFPLAGRNVAVAADWRVRIAGNARPRSGPTLTVATDF